MSKKQELLKNMQKLYEDLENITNEMYENDFLPTETEKVVEKLMNRLELDYEKIVLSTPKEELKEKLYCSKCGKLVYTSDLIDYPYVCLECEENMYSFECEE